MTSSVMTEAEHIAMHEAQRVAQYRLDKARLAWQYRDTEVTRLALRIAENEYERSTNATPRR